VCSLGRLSAVLHRESTLPFNQSLSVEGLEQGVQRSAIRLLTQATLRISFTPA
jgi:hypothetical protein